MAEDSNFLFKEPCPKCGSRDNLARYDDGHGHCFGCGHHETGDGTPSRSPHSNKRPAGMINGEIVALAKRRINEETCRKWNYRVGADKNDRVCQIANYYGEDGTPVAQKIRYADKTFSFVGEPKKALPLFGQQLWRDGGKMVVVTEGELDALSVSQLQQNKWPVVSVPNGAQGAAKSVSKALEWLMKFDKVVFMFDDDEPGRDAAKACAAVLPAGKAYIATIPGFKDANEALVAGQGSAVISAMWDAKAFRPDGIVGMDDVIEAACKPIEYGLSWPWDSLTAATYGRRRGELYGFGGGTGIGKTTLFKQVQAHVLQVDKLPIGVIALEEPVHHSAKTLAGVIDGVRYHVPGVHYDVVKLRDTLVSMTDKAFFYDHFGAATFEVIKAKIRYMAHSLGCKDIFLDHLTALAATMGDDERKAIDTMMAELSALTLELDITIYYISHLTTPEGKAHEEGGRVLEKHFRGSRSIAMWSHFLLAIEGNKQEPDVPRVLRVLKDRYTGDSAGLCIGLKYDKQTGRMIECAVPEDGEARSHGFRDETRKPVSVGGDDDAPF
jgi:twinkle protein